MTAMLFVAENLVRPQRGGSRAVGRQRPGPETCSPGEGTEGVPGPGEGSGRDLHLLDAEPEGGGDCVRTQGGPGATQPGGGRGRSPGPGGGRGNGDSGLREARARGDDTSLSRGEPGVTLPGPRPPEPKFEAAHSPFAHAETPQPTRKAPPGHTASPTHGALQDQVTPTPNAWFEGSVRCVRRRPEPQPQRRQPLLPPSQLDRSRERRGSASRDRAALRTKWFQMRHVKTLPTGKSCTDRGVRCAD
ncbi:uncharacterized protein LOC143272639 [Peromyscus maniculatus bairdii]|uniref:uncharacterized protein LOC143272639 n=1 Tax=Peromyscus maniculatus bairdii TaxID=230844 RepID=UPI003FD2A0F5